MKQMIRGFSIGLFTAAIIIGVIYFMEDNESVSRSTTDTVDSLKEEGYFVYRSNMEEKVDSLENEISQLKKDHETDIPSNQADDSNTDTNDFEYKSIIIEPGMTIDEIMDSLTEEDIISDQGEFLDYLEKNEISRYIQVGEFQLHKDMDMEEIAAIITGEDES